MCGKSLDLEDSLVIAIEESLVLEPEPLEVVQMPKDSLVSELDDSKELALGEP